VPVGSLRGQVTDPSGAAVAGATVAVLPAEGTSSNHDTNRDGIFEVKAARSWKYTVQGFRARFCAIFREDVGDCAGSPMVSNVHLAIQEQQERVIVSDSTTPLDTSGGSNAKLPYFEGQGSGGLCLMIGRIAGRSYRSCWSVCRTERRANLHRWFYRWTASSEIFHPKIPLNQNPFRADMTNWVTVELEILTKPGTDKFHGQFTD